MTTDGEAGRARARRGNRAGETWGISRQVAAWHREQVAIRQRELYLLASGYLDELIAALEKAETLRRIHVRKAGDRRKVPGVPMAEVRA